MNNTILIHTDRGEYVGGDIIYGNVFLYIIQPIPTKSLILEIKGYEKVEWEEEQTEWYEEGGERKEKTIRKQFKGGREFFKDSFPLISYPGGFPVGQFSYPFQYRLPENLPGIFWKKKKGNCPLKAKIQYKVKAILDIPHHKELKIKQNLFIHEKLDHIIQPKHHAKTITVMTCCCIPRGPVTCEAWLDKNSYMSGETAQVHVKVSNGSSVEINHFTTKLIRIIRLQSNQGHVKYLRDIICARSYPGTPAHSNKESDVPLPLNNKKGHYIQPSTSSKFISCEYQVMIEMDIPWAPDLEIYSPITIYAPQNAMWANWQPPSWINEAQVQQVNANLSVPKEILEQQMQKGYFAPPSNYLPSAPPATITINQNISTYQQPIVKETTPLLQQQQQQQQHL